MLYHGSVRYCFRVSFQPTLSFFDVKEALALDPNNKIADVMQQSLQEKAEAFKKKVNILIFSL